MSSLKVFMMFESGVTPTLLSNPNWELMTKNKDTVYFHPEESVHEFVGELFLKNYTINCIPFTDPILLPERKTVFFLVRHAPEGNWDMANKQRYAVPAKGTRVR